MINKELIQLSAGGFSTDSVPGELRKEIVYSGMVAEVMVGEAVALGEILYPLRDDNGTWKLADADAIATMPGLAYVLRATVSGAACLALLDGYVRDDTLDMVTAATGTITIDGNCTEGDLITINGVVFEARTDDTLTTGSDVVLDVSGDLLKATLQAALVAAVEAHATLSLQVSISAAAADVHTITALAAAAETYAGYSGNDITLAKSGTNIAVSGANLTGGVTGGNVYAGLTAGGITLTAPSSSPDIYQRIGFALSRYEMLFRPSLAAPTAS